MPVQSVNINKVSMDYFLRGVATRSRRECSRCPRGLMPEGANAVVAPGLEAAGKMVSLEFAYFQFPARLDGLPRARDTKSGTSSPQSCPKGGPTCQEGP